MTRGEIYRQAAQRVLPDPYGCCSRIYESDADWLSETLPAMKAFVSKFMPVDNTGAFWWPNFSIKSQNERCLLLCLAAAMADAGDL